MFGKKIKGYISDFDLFQAEYDRTHTKSESQLAEIQKYQQVFLARDYPVAEKTHEDEFFS